MAEGSFDEAVRGADYVCALWNKQALQIKYVFQKIFLRMYKNSCWWTCLACFSIVTAAGRHMRLYIITV